jgi:hypothetical protein
VFEGVLEPLSQQLEDVRGLMGTPDSQLYSQNVYGLLLNIFDMMNVSSSDMPLPRKKPPLAERPLNLTN